MLFDSVVGFFYPSLFYPDNRTLRIFGKGRGTQASMIDLGEARLRYNVPQRNLGRGVSMPVNLIFPQLLLTAGAVVATIFALR